MARLLAILMCLGSLVATLIGKFNQSKLCLLILAYRGNFGYDFISDIPRPAIYRGVPNLGTSIPIQPRQTPESK